MIFNILISFLRNFSINLSSERLNFNNFHRPITDYINLTVLKNSSLRVGWDDVEVTGHTFYKVAEKHAGINQIAATIH